MRIRRSGRILLAITLCAVTSAAVLLLQPHTAIASHYHQTSYTYEIGVSKAWDDETEPEPVDVTMTYSGAFKLENTAFPVGSRIYPKEIEILYKGSSCGKAIPEMPSTGSSENYFASTGSFVDYYFTVSIPFHFDGTSTSEYVPFDIDSLAFTFSVGSSQYTLDNNLIDDTGHLYLPNSSYKILNNAMYYYESDPNYQRYDNLLHIINDARFSEESDSGTRYDFQVACDYRNIRTGTEHDASSVNMPDYMVKFTITNSGPKGSLELAAKKTVNGGTPDQAYTFLLLDADGNVLQTKQNDLDGTIRFDAIDYDKDDVDREHAYQVVEKAGTEEGVTYDDSVYDVTVTPVQDPDDVSKIVASPTITKDGLEVSSIAFDNTVEEEQEAVVTPAQTTTTATPEPTPATGDPSGSLPWLAATAAAAAGVFLGLRRRARE